MRKRRTTPIETIRFCAALDRLKVNQEWVARILCRDKNTVSRWANGGQIPAEVSFLLTACVVGKLSVADIERMHMDRLHG